MVMMVICHCTSKTVLDDSVAIVSLCIHYKGLCYILKDKTFFDFFDLKKVSLQQIFVDWMDLLSKSWDKQMIDR
jgi:hypothetical protein